MALLLTSDEQTIGGQKEGYVLHSTPQNYVIKFQTSSSPVQEL